MQILKVEADNFLSYEHLSLALANRGLVLIEGENRDQGGSNGAGKSAIFEAITWALFGVTNRGLKADEVIRLDAQKKPLKNTRVAVTIDLDGHLVEVIRHRKHHKFENKVLLFVDGREITMGGNPETQAKIEELLQIDESSFVNAVMFPQSASGFASLTDSEQKAILDKILGTARFGQAQERVKAKLKRFQSGVEKLRVAKTLKQNQIAQLQNSLWSLGQQNAQFAADQFNRISTLREHVCSQEAKEPVIDVSIDAQITVLQSQIAEHRLREKYAQLQSKQQAFQENDKKLAAERARLSLLQQQVASAGPEPERPEHDLAILNGAELEARALLASKRQELQTRERELRTASQKQQQRDAAVDCPTCGEKLSSVAKDRMFGQLAADIQKLQEECTLLTAEVAAANSTLLVSSEALASLNRKAEVWRTWKTKVDAGAPIPQIEAAVSLLTSVAAQCKTEYEAAHADYGKSYGEADVLRKQVEQLQTQKRDQNVLHSAWRTQLTSLRSQLAAAENEQSPYNSLIAKAEADLAAAESSITMTEVVEKSLAKDVQYLDFWAEGFGNSGVKSLLLDTCAPFLSYRGSSYLEQLTGGSASIEFCTQKTLASGDKRDKFEVVASYQNGGAFYRSVSGGERRRVDLACLFALGDLAASRSLAPVSLKLLDEPFDALDAAGAEAVVRLLKTHIVPTCKTVLVMSHSDDIKQLIDRKILVIKENGISRIESR